jgi:Tol biopolymer transport system component
MYALAPMLVAMSVAAAEEVPKTAGSYLGQDPPGLTPEIFAPGVVSTEDHEFGIAFSPDGREFFFTRMQRGAHAQVIMGCVEMENGWQSPEVAPFSGTHADMEPSFSPDGTMLYFVSFRPIPDQEGFSPDIWMSKKMEGAWGEARHMGPPFNPGRAMYFSFTDDGVLYTTDAANRGGILTARPTEDGYTAFEKLGGPIATGREAHPWVAADGSYLIFDAVGEAGRGLYISFKKEDGGWGDPVSMKEHTGEGGIAALSPDGKYLFFTDKGDIYWVKAEVIEMLRKK